MARAKLGFHFLDQLPDFFQGESFQNIDHHRTGDRLDKFCDVCWEWHGSPVTKDGSCMLSVAGKSLGPRGDEVLSTLLLGT